MLIVETDIHTRLLVQAVLQVLVMRLHGNCEVYSSIDEFLQLGQSGAVSLQYCHLIDVKLIVPDNRLYLHDCSVHVQFLQEVVILGWPADKLCLHRFWCMALTWCLVVIWRIVARKCLYLAMDGKEQDTESLEDGKWWQVLINCLLHLRILFLVSLGEDWEVERPSEQWEITTHGIEALELVFIGFRAYLSWYRTLLQTRCICKRLLGCKCHRAD